jgi:uroporphyrinogen decarboxylase
MFFSVRTYKGITNEAYRQIAQESDRAVLGELNAKSDYNILHICGYTGSQNDLSLYRTYSAKAYNWDVHVESLGIGQGKEFFDGKTVLGGFNNRPNSLLHIGSREDITAEARRLIEEAGPAGFILGADCTLPNDIELERLQWVKEAGLR